MNTHERRRPSRRTILSGAAWASGAALTGCALETDTPAYVEGADESDLDIVRVGYLHTVAVDAHMWLGLADGIFAEHGLDVRPIEFGAGVAESQALLGGSIDVAIMGAVLSNFPAQGGSTVFLANNVEYDTAQLWVSGDSGIAEIADLAGRRVLTTEGTTAHVYLHTALTQAGVDPDSVTIVNSDMPAAVTAFVSGAAPAVALWVPFDETVRENADDAEMIDSAEAYYPDSAILGGWTARDDFYAQYPGVIDKIATAWLDINDRLVNDPDTSLRTIHDEAYAEQQSLEDTERQYSFSKLFTNDEWAKMLRDGEVTNWIGQVQRVFVEVGGLSSYRNPDEFVDTDVVLDAYRDWKPEADS